MVVNLFCCWLLVVGDWWLVSVGESWLVVVVVVVGCWLLVNLCWWLLVVGELPPVNKMRRLQLFKLAKLTPYLDKQPDIWQNKIKFFMKK